MGFFDSINLFALSNYYNYDKDRRTIKTDTNTPKPKPVIHATLYDGCFDKSSLSELEDYISHEGKKRRSGRYPWGQGNIPYQHEPWFRGFGEGNSTISRLEDESDADYKARLDKYAKQKAEEYDYHFNHFVNDLRTTGGLKNSEIAEVMGISVDQLTARASISKATYMADRQQVAMKIMEENPGITKVKAAELMGVGDTTFANFIKDDYLTKTNRDIAVSKLLKDRVDEKGYIDIGEGSEHWISENATTLKRAANILKEEGYVIETISVKQPLNPNNTTSVLVLAKPGETKRSIWQNKDKIVGIQDFVIDEDAATDLGLKYKPQSIDSSRIFIKYGDEKYSDGFTGTDRDGIIQIRRGVEDLSLGNSNYSQVRIAVDGKNFLKGMAVYTDDIPDGYDIIFNTNKPKGTPTDKVFKPLVTDQLTGEIDWNNPFGATVKKNGQSTYIGKDGEEHVSAINKVNDEGDWSSWNKSSISSQMLSKQSLTLAKHQMELSKQLRESQLDEIMTITNPVVKQKMLLDYAENCDKAAVDLKAMSFPGQRTKVLIAIPSLKDDEAYLPDYEPGSHVVAVRFPHGHISEIPNLKVNSSNKEAISTLGKNPVDAIGLSPRTLERLSGADSDGDTAVVIPNNDGKIRWMDTLPELIGFDDKKEYPQTATSKVMPKTAKQRQMGIVANLLADMNDAGAPLNEIADVLRHSMVVIDASKHKLNYEKSSIDHHIAEYKAKYQKHGASTLISKRNLDLHIDEIAEGKIVTDPVTGKQKKLYIDPSTGEKLYSPTGKTHTKVHRYKTKPDVITEEPNKTTVKLLDYTKDARTLSSGSDMDNAYADYHNWMQTQGNKARKLSLSVGSYTKDPNAEKAYSEEVQSLYAKVVKAQKKAPIERQAQIYANIVIEEKERLNPVLKTKAYEDERTRMRTQAIAGARARLGKEKEPFNLTEKEVEAINAHAVSPTTLNTILRYADDKTTKQLFLPKTNKGLTSSQIATIKAMLNQGYSQNDIAEQYGISTSIVSDVKLGKIKDN